MLAVAFAAVALIGVACGGDEKPNRETDPTSTAGVPELSGSLNVFAAASLTEAFTEMGKAFEAANPGLKVTFNFSASSALAQQINEGGPADVFVSADEANMKKVTDATRASDPRIVARNRLAILVEKGNPKMITGLADLAKPGIVLVLCAPEVPCGKFAAAALQRAAVAAKPASLEENVKAVVSKVTLGEADAGIVYVTDVAAVGNKGQGVDIATAGDPALEAVYPMAVTTKAANRDAARAWVDFALSGAGSAILEKYGFLAP
jgi:molybdate transport system substrate-binding protein